MKVGDRVITPGGQAGTIRVLHRSDFDVQGKYTKEGGPWFAAVEVDGRHGLRTAYLLDQLRPEKGAP